MTPSERNRRRRVRRGALMLAGWQVIPAAPKNWYHARKDTRYVGPFHTQDHAWAFAEREMMAEGIFENERVFTWNDR